MSFQPFVIGSGLNAWISLNSTMDRQRAAFSQRADVTTEVARFKEELQSINTPEDLVDNRSALSVALGAFDLSEDLNNRYFIRRILEEGPTEDTALANRLRDGRYLQLSQKFSPANFLLGVTKLDVFTDDVAEQFAEISFEKAVGEADPDLRLALGFRRAIPDVADAVTNDAAWFQVLAHPPVKEVFQQVFGLPTQFGLLDIDRQHEIMIEKAETHLGTSELSELTSEEVVEDTIRSFLLKRQVSNLTAASPMQTALSLVSAIPRASLFDAIQA